MPLPRLLAVRCALTVLGLIGLGAGHAQEPQLTPVPARISDEAIDRDGQVYDAMEQRLKALNDRGLRLSDYNMGKAQCWLDVSYHEYARNDRSAFPQLALEQAQRIIEGLENNAPPPHDTPLINDAARIRADLWQKLEAIEAGPQLECAARTVACAEVELVHAGNEYKYFGWRHANPYIGIAEDLTDQAGARASACQPPPPAVAGPATPSAPERVERVMFKADTLFAFKRSDLAALSPTGRDDLDALIAKLAHAKVVTVTVVGYTDRIDVHHDPRRNQRLSEARAATVAHYLEQHGVPAAVMTSYGRGAASPVVACDDASLKGQALYACLAPNRRVEVVVATLAAPM